MNRYQIALGRDKPQINPVVKKLRGSGFPDVEEKDVAEMRRDKAALLNSLLDQAIENSGVRISEETLPPVRSSRFSRPIRDPSPGPTDDEEFFRELMEDPSPRPRRRLRTPADDDVTVTRAPGSVHMTLRGPGGFNAMVPIRNMNAVVDREGNLVLRLPGRTASQFVEDFDAAIQRQRGR